ncbi:hypothetical protein ZYGR_0I02110 [Zygosaccharomyces rouxii]|uniref:Genetic interactor of prohibitin 7, mitochondrial n=2 Tax=Zygosaccharomyces rouxii TaxID=4956 RepID=GEP7_ZYGRC|nr:uncharacterized protein ZYRO0C04972g [Zygosaccharomyces rouxii]C5DT30.1 RecName: Full=Genetic interactor of prohibitin 7, mitochondrial; Flags: Precursor [Zygosaccharomyces rouxii CBS 732]KAH9201872.1 genetic interactor of prohibitin 7, mitochondrial [Zygosaccharomyces rouxii]GAV47915.1 hypothetical protein ZYGR_0I02110 [Zygosaccharomyces rouxii]CAR26941.1 ZYRO0C04972p [Zygosaccharomyces rouxii]
MSQYRFPIRILTRFYTQASSRLPPKSLLIKQADRIRRSKDGQADGSKLMVSSLKDIASMFQANAETPEDEEREILNQQNYLRQQIESGELERLLQDKFNLDESISLMSTNLLVQQFPKLNAQQVELIQEAVSMDSNKHWNEIPQYMKQLQFYFAFGSHGPRLSIPFNSREKPLDFAFKIPSPVTTDGQTKIHKLKPSHLVNLHTITDQRSKIFQTTKLDPATRCILWSAILVSIVFGVQEWRLQQDPQAKITVLSNSV